MKKPLYIFSSGELKRKDNTIFFESEQGKKYIPVENTNEIFIFGEVDINKRFLEFLTQAKIILHFFNRYNYYVGSFYPREHLNSGYMILRQAENYLDYEKRLLIAKKFVLGAVGNILQVIGYYRRRGKKLENIEASIKALAEKIPAGSTIEELMALEGNVRDYYYRTFDSILNDSDFVFQQRSKRPPKNNLNTLISFGNSLLYVIILSEIFQTHLDPRIGFLHATNFRRFSLNLDVAEIFKPIIVDRLIFKLVGKRMLTKNDFESGTDSLMMKEKARHLFVTELDNKLKSTISYHSLGRNVSYRRLIRLELYKLEKHLMDEKEYEPFLAKW
jgi:CRISPR-associated protein Cas1